MDAFENASLIATSPWAAETTLCCCKNCMDGSGAAEGVAFMATLSVRHYQSAILSFVLSSSLRDAHHQFAEVATFQQADKSLGRGFQSIHNIFSIPDLTGCYPRRHLTAKSRTLIDEFPLDETANEQAAAQDFAHDTRQTIRSGAWCRIVVLGDQSTDRYAREIIEKRKDGVPDMPADILEIDIDALRTSGFELR